MRRLALLLVLAVAGCGGGHELMPLSLGKKWNYSVNANFKTYTSEVTVTQKTGVADTEGYVLSGPMGESRLAWKDGVLVAEKLINTRFEPAIPLVIETDSKVLRRWEGKAMGLWGTATGKAVLEQAPGQEKIGGRTVKTTKTVLTLTLPKSTVRLQTMFQPGGGILTQRQWIDGNLVLSLERLSGS